MNKNIIITLIIGLIVGIGGTIAVNALTNNNADVAKPSTTTEQTMVSEDSSMSSMADMNKKLEGLSGDEFDKAFLEMMIAHHQGAIDMATLATTRAKQEEIKTLSQAIITAQNQEIQDMQKWQMDWGFMSNDSSMPGMNQGSSN